jgi:hypothetical protein
MIRTGALLLLGFFLVSVAHAQDYSPILKRPKKNANFEERIRSLAAALYGKPYELGPLGEGPGSPHPNPLYRLDAFDCTTYVETVMANLRCYGKNAECLEKTMAEIRYRSGKPGFEERNHVPELDWLPNNVNAGFLEELNIFPEARVKIHAGFDRAAWLRKQGVEPKEKQRRAGDMSYIPIHFFFTEKQLTAEEKKQLDESLKSDLAELEPGEDSIKPKYRKEMAFLRAAYEPKQELLHEIPHGTVINLVRGPVADETTTPLIIHQGIVVQESDATYIWHAAANVGHVSRQNLGDYLLNFLRNKKVRGINLYRILP